MAQKNRAQMLTDITTNIFNNVINFITGQNAQDRLVNLLDSSPNIISDKDQPNGYVGLDAVGSMFSSYYNENISRADLVTLLTTNTAIGYKLYQVNDAVGATKILLVIADSNITLYPFAIDLTTAEIGTYNINTDTFTVLVGSGNASIISTTVTGLQGLQTTSSLSTTTLYNVTDAVGNTLILQVYAIANNTNVVYAIDVASGTIGTYNITTDTFTATTSTPDLQQVTDIGNTTTNQIISDDGAGSFTAINNGRIDIASNNTGAVKINASQVTANYDAQLPDKPGSTETFAMLSDIPTVTAGTNISVTGTTTAPIINSLSDRYKTTSSSSILIGNGSKTFTVDANLSYIPLQEVLIVYNPSNHMHGTVTSYSGTTLVVDVKTNTGSGTFTSWVINLDGTPVDAITGVGAANRLAYFTAAQVIDDVAVITAARALKSDANGLPVHFDTATEPSLTELSYVKGVTSSIQNQLNGKEATITAGTTAQYWRGDKSWQTLDKNAVGLGNVDNTSDATKNSATATLTNKRINARTGTVASSATPTINTDNVDYFSITALAVAITSFTTNLSGTPNIGQTLWISITDNGTARAITWGASFESSGNVTLPTTTVISTRLDVAFIWNEATSKWRCVGVA